MLDIKTFKDGSRLVLVIDGLEAVDEKEVLKTLLEGLCQKGNVETVDRVNATAPEPEREYSYPQGVFTDGPYIGKRPDEVITGTLKEQFTAFKWMGEAIKNNAIIPPELTSKAKEALNAYIKAFFSKITDAKAFVEEMTLEDKRLFLETFSCAITDAQKKSIEKKIKVSNWEFSNWGEDVMSNSIYLITRKFQSLGNLTAA